MLQSFGVFFFFLLLSYDINRVINPTTLYPCELKWKGTFENCESKYRVPSRNRARCSRRSGVRRAKINCGVRVRVSSRNASFIVPSRRASMNPFDRASYLCNSRRERSTMHGALAQSRVSLARRLNNKTLIATPFARFAGAIIIRYADQFHVIVVYNAHLRPHGISRRKHSGCFLHTIVCIGDCTMERVLARYISLTKVNTTMARMYETRRSISIFICVKQSRFVSCNEE